MNIRFGLKAKLLTAAGLAVLVMALAFLILFWNMSRIDRSYRNVIDLHAAVVVDARELHMHATQVNGSIRDFILTKDPEAVNKVNNALESISRIVADLQPKVRQAEDQELLRQIAGLHADLSSRVKEFFSKTSADSATLLNEASSNVFPAARDLRSKSDLLAQHQKEQMDEAISANTASVNAARRLSLIICLVAMLFAAALAYILASRMSKPLIALTSIAKRMAEGDMSPWSVVYRGRDEIRNLIDSFAATAGHLRELLRTTSESARQVAASSQDLSAAAEQSAQAARQIAEAIQDVAKNAETQNQTSGENVRAMNEIARSTGQVAESASSVYASARESAEKAGTGREAIVRFADRMRTVGETVRRSDAAIGELEQQSAEIGRIAELIGAIAGQTNLLALNASIEAARAGENGRGFAVVAGEIKKLASQSEEAVKQVVEIVEHIQRGASGAVKAMRDIGAELEDSLRSMKELQTAFESIFEAAKKTEADAEDLSAVSQQIAAGTEEVTASVEQIARLAEQSAANAEEVSAAAEEQLASMEEIASSADSLREMSRQLNEMVARFKF